MALDLPAIRQALVDKITAGVQRKINGYAYDPGSPALPAVIIRDVDADSATPYHSSFGGPMSGTVEYSFDIEVLIPLAGDMVSAQKILDEFRSVGAGMTNSVANALEANPRTLGGLVDDVSCPVSSVPLAFVPDSGEPVAISTLLRVQLLADRE